MFVKKTIGSFNNVHPSTENQYLDQNVTENTRDTENSSIIREP